MNSQLIAYRCWLAPLIILALSLSSTASRADDVLFNALGGMAGITEITDNFLYHLSSDERVIDFFAESDIDRFHAKVVEHICELSGGPCHYTGDSMLDTHRGMAINDTQFNAVVEDLIKAMDDSAIEFTTQNRLLKILANLHGEIVGH